MSSLAIAWMFPFLWVVEMPLASSTSFSQQQVTTILTQLLPNYPAYNVSAWTALKTPFLCFCLQVVA
jgi:hypothetical protein